MKNAPDSSISRKASLMRRRSQQLLALTLATGAAVATFSPLAMAQLAPAGATSRPAGAAAATQPATTQSTTRPGANGLHGITTQPGGGLMLNFKGPSIDSVLDELSAAAGF